MFQDNTVGGHVREFSAGMGRAFMDMLEHSYVSVTGLLVLVALSVLFVPVKVSRSKRVVIGLLHASAHLTAAMALMMMLEIGLETCVRHRLLGTSGYHSLYDWYHSKEGDHFPDPTGLRARMESWTFGLYPACVKYLMTAFDMPEVMAVTRSNICKTGMDSLPRGFVLAYYTSVFLYYWVFSTPVVSLVFGSYLFACINWLHLHFDEAFSSLRIANYKSFLRCHITPTGDMDIYTLAIDKVPKEWALDPQWELEQTSQVGLAAHRRKHPSQWIPVGLHRDKNYNVRIIDHFQIKRDHLKINDCKGKLEVTGRSEESAVTSNNDQNAKNIDSSDSAAVYGKSSSGLHVMANITENSKAKRDVKQFDGSRNREGLCTDVDGIEEQDEESEVGDFQVNGGSESATP